MTWLVETLNSEVDAEIASLDADLQAKFLRLGEMFAQFGPQGVHEPHVKSLKLEGIPFWEMRLSGRNKIARAIYVTQVGERIVVLHAFIKKSQKTPSLAIATALRRYQLLINAKKD